MYYRSKHGEILSALGGSKEDSCMHRNTLTAVLFTGGESKRMGADKATLQIAGAALWSRQLATLRSLSPDALLISARARPAWTPDSIEVALDAPPAQGPLSGLISSLKSVKTTHLLALAIDLPDMTACHLLRLWQLASPDAGVFPQRGEFYEPLCAIYPVCAISSASQMLAAGQRSLQGLVKHLRQQSMAHIYSVTNEEEVLYRNLNHPEDLLPGL
jgi:molybdopterin-guanine dinucleotide biosynthesis protein A